MMVSRVDYNTG